MLRIWIAISQSQDWSGVSLPVVWPSVLLRQSVIYIATVPRLKLDIRGEHWRLDFILFCLSKNCSDIGIFGVFLLCSFSIYEDSVQLLLTIFKSLDRYGEAEGTTLTDTWWRNLDLAAWQLNYLLHNCQSKAKPGIIIGGSPVKLTEEWEKSADLLRCYTLTSVTDRYSELARWGLSIECRDEYLSIFSVPDRILNQVDEHLLKPSFISQKGRKKVLRPSLISLDA